MPQQKLQMTLLQVHNVSCTLSLDLKNKSRYNAT